MSRELYVKEGRKYVPADVRDFGGFPSDGVWLVETSEHCKSQRLIIRPPELTRLGGPPAAMTVASIERHRDAIVDALRNKLDSMWDDLHGPRHQCSASVNDMVSVVIDALTKATVQPIVRPLHPPARGRLAPADIEIE